MSVGALPTRATKQHKIQYMYEKVNPQHPDKIADRIAGAIVDLAYKERENPHVAVEVLIGHKTCHIINETDTLIDERDVIEAVKRITRNGNGDFVVDYKCVPQDNYLNEAQKKKVVCGDNGIFRGVPTTPEQRELTRIAGAIYDMMPFDGKYILDLDTNSLIICQSNIGDGDTHETEYYDELDRWLTHYKKVVNPIGNWYGGTDVDTGATNRKLGSDMGDAVTGGGLHGKDLSKADVAVNIYLHMKAQDYGRRLSAYCNIGSDVVYIDGTPHDYGKIVEAAREYVNDIGGFEKLAEWGLIHP